jgi:hypothetical protein
MAVSSGDTITAAQFNNLQSRIAQVLGTGSGSFGYGQNVASLQVLSIQDPSIPDGDTVLAAQFNDLRADMNAAYTHQNGSQIPIGEFAVGDIVGADQSGTDLDREDDNFIFVNPDSSKGFNDLLNEMTDIENNRFVIDASQQQIEVRAADERITNWNGTIISEFTASFANADERRYFFNAAGQIRISGTVDLSTSTGDSQDRDEGWSDLIENPGEIQFDYNSTTITGSSTGVTFPDGVIGNDSLTSSFQEIFKKDANGGVYGDSYWKIDARLDSSSTIRFRITLVDAGPESNPDEGVPGGIEPGVTEPVTADLEFEYSARRANGAVVVDFPAYVITNTFE